MQLFQVTSAPLRYSYVYILCRALFMEAVWARVRVLYHWRQKTTERSRDKQQAGFLFGCKGWGMNAMEVCVCRASAMYIMPVLMQQLLLWIT